MNVVYGLELDVRFIMFTGNVLNIICSLLFVVASQNKTKNRFSKCPERNFPQEAPLLLKLLH